MEMRIKKWWFQIFTFPEINKKLFIHPFMEIRVGTKIEFDQKTIKCGVYLDMISNFQQKMVFPHYGHQIP